MSLEAWGDEEPNAGYVTDKAADEMVSEKIAEAKTLWLEAMAHEGVPKEVIAKVAAYFDAEWTQ